MLAVLCSARCNFFFFDSMILIGAFQLEIRYSMKFDTLHCIKTRINGLYFIKKKTKIETAHF